MAIDPSYFEKMANFLFDGVYFVDRDRRILYWNRAAGHITGYRQDEVVGTRCQDNVLIHLDDQGQSLCQSHVCPSVKAMRTGMISSLNRPFFIQEECVLGQVIRTHFHL